MQQTAPLESHHAEIKRFPPVNTAGKLLKVKGNLKVHMDAPNIGITQKRGICFLCLICETSLEFLLTF